MNLISSKLAINKQKIVIFGAGKIGRSFIGQLFGRAGYSVVFIDVDPLVVKLLNEKQGYRVIIKSNKEEEIFIPNVSAVLANETERVISEISTAGIMAVSVGKNALRKIIPVIAEGLLQRYETDKTYPLDIILAENMRDAAAFVSEELKPILPANYPLNQLVGLIETSIGKMVPIMSQIDLNEDPLQVFAEPYNTLILDQKAFRNPIPEISGLAPKENIKAWVDRKAFVHNLGHATAAYFGHFKHPEAIFMYELLDNPEVYQFTRKTMMQAAEILQHIYRDDFTMKDLEGHVDDLLYRFQNRALRDTVFRVGMDLPRKLGADDRFMGIIRMAQSRKMPYDFILKAMSYGFSFRAKDENGKSFREDETFLTNLENDFTSTIQKYCGLNCQTDEALVQKLKELYVETKSKQKSDV